MPDNAKNRSFKSRQLKDEDIEDGDNVEAVPKDTALPEGGECK